MGRSPRRGRSEVGRFRTPPTHSSRGAPSLDRTHTPHRRWIVAFFGCSECARHFDKMWQTRNDPRMRATGPGAAMSFSEVVET